MGKEKEMIIKGKDLIERISDKEYSEDLIKELEKYEVGKPKSVWGLKDGDEYWLIYRDDFSGNYFSRIACWCGWEIQIRRRELGLIHLTEERAKLHARVLNTELDVKKWKRENDNVELDWDDENQYKYFLEYDCLVGKIYTDWWRTHKYANTIYFSSADKAQQCINDIGEERIIEWIKWEDNGQ